MTTKKKKKAENEGALTASATLKHVRISPRKLRLVVNLVKGKHVEEALKILRFNPKKGSRIAEKTLQAAIANAREAKGADADKLWIKDGWVNMGRTIERYMPGAQGRANPIRKRSSHLTFVLSER